MPRFFVLVVFRRRVLMLQLRLRSMSLVITNSRREELWVGCLGSWGLVSKKSLELGL